MSAQNFSPTMVLSVPTDYLSALSDPEGWKKVDIANKLSNPIFLVKELPVLQQEIRLTRWENQNYSTETLYAVEIESLHSTETIYALGRGVGAPVLKEIFENAWHRLESSLDQANFSNPVS